ncbi:MAG: FHA domain-containing protein [Acidobacteria bacterium]|nr:FHA domain-containing protein [Acidobacteriota bacterium]
MPSAAISNPLRPVRLRDYRYAGELVSLSATFVVLLSLFALFTVFFPTTWSATVKTMALALAGLAVYVATVKLQHRAAFGTLVRVSSRQFPELFAIANEAAERLSADYVPVYVKRQSEMNIYTLGLWQRPLIVVTSSLVDQMPPDALQFFIGREIGHVQAGHTWLRTLLKPLGTDVPVIGKLMNSVIFGDWMNRTEFTADRAGFIACRSLTTAISTMLKFGVGIRLYEKLDIREYLDQINEVRDVRGHLTEIIAEQPYLVQRVRSLAKYSLAPTANEIVPTRRDRTGILKDLPTAFVNTAALQAASGNTGEHPSSRRSSQDTIADLPINLDDTQSLEPEAGDDNARDPLYLLHADESGAMHQLRRRLTRIGRSPDNDIVIESDRVSRFHAEIVRDVSGFVVSDLKSRNGVWVNGDKITGPERLTSGDKLRVGRAEFTLEILEPRIESPEYAKSTRDAGSVTQAY